MADAIEIVVGQGAKPGGGGMLLGQKISDRVAQMRNLPKGIDHILFVLGLFLLSVRLRPILIQVTTFTIAHSITLGLTMYGIVSPPSRVVEPLIALRGSIRSVGSSCLVQFSH